ncbi:molybdopterin-dependent oxidoreductase [Vagococcus sp. WN89Y]|uniref:molybdopterin-dependent oxidoreductase n=1 Tax=Vagococcus sp. WN89Y TaxID=3457258 RepID=UPI003FCE2B4E
MKSKLIQGYCALCRSRCGTLNEITGGRLTNVQADQNHPTSGAVCLKGKAAPELIYSENRVLWPLRRTRSKESEDPGWERISWKDALDEIAEKLLRYKKESGAESVAFGVTTPSGTPIIDSVEWIERFVRLYGSPNMYYNAEVCNWHKDVAHTFTFGCAMPAADYKNAELIILWGNNPAATWLAQASAIGEGRKRGAKMLVIDPRHTELAASADVWLNINPGTDLVLAMGLIHQLLSEKQFDVSFVRNWTNAPLLVNDETGLFLRENDIDPDRESNHYLIWDNNKNTLRPCTPNVAGNKDFYQRAALSGGFSVLLHNGRTVLCTPSLVKLQQAVAPYNLDYVAKLTGITAEKLKEAILLIANSSRIAYHAWVGIAQSLNATQSERAIAIFYALTGAFDICGGNRIYASPPTNQVNKYTLCPQEQRNKALGLSERPLGPPANGYIATADLQRAILDGQPYPVRAFVCFGANMLSSHGNVDTAVAALKQLEFHVHCDHFVTPTARFADILLPACTLWEREALKIGFEISARAQAHVQLRPRLVPPQGQSQPDYAIVFQLACRMGLEEAFFHGDVDAAFNHILQPSGLTTTLLRQHPGGITLNLVNHEKKYSLPHPQTGIPAGFATETGKVELYSEKLFRHGYPPVPEFHSLAQQDENFPLRLTTMKHPLFCHSQHRSLVSLRRRAPDPQAIISRAVANLQGIENKDWIEVVTASGKARFTAKIDDAINDDVVIAEYGWWQGCVDLNQPELPVRGECNSNYNALVNYETVDAISGSVPLRMENCAVRRIGSSLAWKGERIFTVSRIVNETADVKSISFIPTDGYSLPDWQPGQDVILRVFCAGEPEGICRAYTLSSAAGQNRYTISVKLSKGTDNKGNAWKGQVSSWVHEQLRVGDEVTLTAPDGAFIIPRHRPAPVVMVAGGIGITPFISYLSSLNPQEHGADIWLYYANRNSDHHAFRQQLHMLAQQIPHLNIVNVYQEPKASDLIGRDYQYRGFISAGIFAENLINARARFYLCGPDAMVSSLETGLIRRGVFSFDIFKELFTPPGRRIATTKASYNVTFAKTGKTLLWSADSGTLLQFAEKNHIPMAGGCRVGVCGCCAVKVKTGEVESLSDADSAQSDTFLACQCVPASDIIVDA